MFFVDSVKGLFVSYFFLARGGLVQLKRLDFDLFVLNLKKKGIGTGFQFFENFENASFHVDNLSLSKSLAGST